MIEYVTEYRVIGEVADLLLLKRPIRKLLVDISPDQPDHDATSFRRHPNRTTHTITDPALIAALSGELEIGDVVEVSGSFTQSNYIPYRTTHIDTTFLASKFQILVKAAQNLRQKTVRQGPRQGAPHGRIN